MTWSDGLAEPSTFKFKNMSHQLDYNEQTQQYSFFSVKEKAWHGLGQIVQDYPASSDALAFAGLDFEVVKHPLYAVPERKPNDMGVLDSIPVPRHFATVRTDRNTTLGVVGKDYEVIQNRDAFAFFDALVGGGDGIFYETAGALNQGARIFITAKLPNYIKVGNDDVIEQYIFLTNTHDGSGSIIAAFTPIRVVCNNTLNAAVRNCSNMVKIKHTANAKDRLKEAHKVMDMINTISPVLDNIFNNWSKVRIDDAELKKLVEKAMSPSKEVLENVRLGDYEQLSTVFKNTCDKVLEYANTCPSQQLSSTKGTLFGAYNAITGYYQNLVNYKDESAKLKSLMYGGTAQQRSQVAFNLCDAFFSSSDFIIN